MTTSAPKIIPNLFNHAIFAWKTRRPAQLCSLASAEAGRQQDLRRRWRFPPLATFPAHLIR